MVMSTLMMTHMTTIQVLGIAESAEKNWEADDLARVGTNRDGESEKHMSDIMNSSPY